MKKNSKLLFLIMCIVLISTFGVFAVGALGHSEHGTCPISALSGGDCSVMDSAIAVVSHHISGIQALTEATVTSSMGIALMVLSALMIPWFIKPTNLILNLMSNFRYIYTRRTVHPVFVRMLKWIVLRNKLNMYSYATASSGFRS